MKKELKILVIIIMFLMTIISCQRLDIVGNNAIKKFEIILDLLSDNVSFNLEKNAWELAAPDLTTRFFYNSDIDESRLFDVWIEFDATPFIESGLDVARLPSHLVFDPFSNRLVTGIKIISSERFETALSTFEHIVKSNRRLIKYHQFGDHYGLDIGNNNMLHWARRVELIEGQLSFILNPEQFIIAGADVTSITGWRNPTVRAHSGRKVVSESRVVKPFNLLLLQEDGLNKRKPVIYDMDIVIKVAEITENALYFPVQIDEVLMEVIAVKAPDGTIRTVFNTCQVCYSSSFGYFEQIGAHLVCRNCGNRYRMSQLERASGGCNPEPIFAENKTVTDETITISKEFLKNYKYLFEKIN